MEFWRMPVVQVIDGKYVRVLRDCRHFGKVTKAVDMQSLRGGAIPGLECLAATDHPKIRQTLEFLEIITGFEQQNRYIIFDHLDRPILHATEQSNLFHRQFLGSSRPFRMSIVDNANRGEVLFFKRPYRCGCVCFPACYSELFVFSSPGVRVGRLKRVFSCSAAIFHVWDGQGTFLFMIEGPLCPCSVMGRSVLFQVFGPQRSLVAKIWKHYSGLMQEFATDADNFGIDFLTPLDVAKRALLLGAVFLIDYVFFEK